MAVLNSLTGFHKDEHKRAINCLGVGVQGRWSNSDIVIIWRQALMIKKASPHFKGKAERPFLTGQTEFYQLLEYYEGIDIEKKLRKCENFYNCHRPYTALKEKTPYKLLREKFTSS